MKEKNSKILKHILNLEIQISNVFGKQILNYINILHPNANISINIPKLTKSSSTLLTTYIHEVTQLFDNLNYSFISKEYSLAAKFLEISKELYFVRYIQAKILFAQYGLIRLPTKVEIKLKKLMNIAEPNEDYLIFKKDLIAIDKFGNYDQSKTILKEKTGFDIALTLSVLPQVEKMSKLLLRDLKKITLKALAPDFFENKLLILGEELAEYLLSLFGTQMYQYINRGISVKEGRNNLIAYYNKQIKPPARKFPNNLPTIEEDVKKIIQHIFISDKNMTPETKDFLFQDYIELVLLYIREGSFIPHNYFKLKFRKIDFNQSNEHNKISIIESYLLNLDGSISDIPIEKYAITFTPASKILIFENVTNNLENPLFTLEDYLELQ